MSNLDQYLENKRIAEKRAAGFTEFAAIKIYHVSFDCNCGGDNPACRQVVRREWRKPPKPAQARNKQ